MLGCRGCAEGFGVAVGLFPDLRFHGDDENRRAAG